MEKRYLTKKGVRMDGVQPVIILALNKISRIYADYERPLVVTSAIDGEHKTGSLHWIGLAVDIRSRFFDKPGIIAADIHYQLKSLDKRYQVIVEKDHIHIEFDRRLNNG